VHEALASTLAGDPDRSIWHRAALASGTDEALARDLEQAGLRASRRGASDVALTALQRAVELSDPDHRAGRMLFTAELAYDRGWPDIATRLLHDIQRLDLTILELARARFIRELLNPHGLGDHGRVAELVDIAEQAGAAGDLELYHRLLWVVASRMWWANPGDETRQLLVDAAKRAGEPTVADPRLVSIHAYADPYTSSPKVISCLRAVSDVSVTDPDAYLATAGLITGSFYDSMLLCGPAIDQARTSGRLGALPRLLAIQAILAVRIPRWEIAIPAAEEARTLATELDQPIWLATAETAIAMIEALPLGARHIVALAQSGPIVSALARARNAEAYELAQRLLDPGSEFHHRSFALMAIGDLAEGAALTQNAAAARLRCADVEAIVGPEPAEWLAINLRHARAVLAEDDEAELRYEQALNADLDQWPLWRGRLLLAYGRWLRRSQRLVDSRAPLRQARDIFDRIGVVSWSDQARLELRASGESSQRRAAAEARDELTAQELQIAQLAGEGLSNREIGQRLFLSHRTVSTHLYRVFPKLGITSRAEIAMALGSLSEAR
jgi:DNA-binding CsgD family transcriptional regulator